MAEDITLNCANNCILNLALNYLWLFYNLSISLVSR